MPSIFFFADQSDRPIIQDRLNTDKEIAFIVPDGPLTPAEADARTVRATFAWTGASQIDGLDLIDTGYRQRWKAVEAVSGLSEDANPLWHMPAGPLLLSTESEMSGGGLRSGYLGHDPLQSSQPLQDPWRGWVDVGSRPLSGLGRHNVIGLHLHTRCLPYSEAEQRSQQPLLSYWMHGSECLVASDIQWIGGGKNPALRPTVRWWSRLRKWFLRSTVTLSDPRHARAVFFAFPSALRRLQGGIRYEARGWSLDVSILRSRPQ